MPAVTAPKGQSIHVVMASVQRKHDEVNSHNLAQTWEVAPSVGLGVGLVTAAVSALRHHGHPFLTRTPWDHVAGMAAVAGVIAGLAAWRTVGFMQTPPPPPVAPEMMFQRGWPLASRNGDRQQLSIGKLEDRIYPTAKAAAQAALTEGGNHVLVDTRYAFGCYSLVYDPVGQVRDPRVPDGWVLFDVNGPTNDPTTWHSTSPHVNMPDEGGLGGEPGYLQLGNNLYQDGESWSGGSFVPADINHLSATDRGTY
jgi:hypothetical protein